MSYKLYFTVFLLFSALVWGQAQQVIEGNQNIYDESKGIIYEREFTVDVKLLQTDGFSVGINIGQLKTYYLTRYFNFEFGELRHQKRFRQSFDFQQQASRISKAFVYGKQNNLYVLRGGFGEKRYLSEKAKRRGVAVGISYEGGLSLGILNPRRAAAPRREPRSRVRGRG